MIRAALFPNHRPHWIAASLTTLMLAACGGKDTRTDEVSAAPSTSPAVSVTPASGPTVTTELGGTISRTVTFEEAEAVFKEGKYPEAKRLFEAYVERKPENGFGWYMLGLSAWKSGDLLGAERAFDTAIGKNPTHVKSLLNSSRVLMDLGRNAEALERVNAARAIDSTSGEVIRLVARAHHRLGNIDSAVAAYRQALGSNERDVWAMNNLGMLYLDQQDPGSAVGPLARAVELRPTSPVFQNNLGMVLELVGDFEQAKAAYESAVKADSGYAKARANAARLGAVVIDSTSSRRVDLAEFAELFRQQVKLWSGSR